MAGAAVALSVTNWATASRSAGHRIAVTTRQNFSNFGVQTLVPVTLRFTSLAAVAITPPCPQPDRVVNLTNVRSTAQPAFSGGGTHRWAPELTLHPVLIAGTGVAIKEILFAGCDASD